MEGIFGVFVFLVVGGFWTFVLYVLWHILQALQSIDRSVDDVAKSLRNQKSS
jgi:hypothetical protein